jgi:hypothetical protein
VRRIRDDQNPVQPALDPENHHPGAPTGRSTIQIDYGPIKQRTITMQDCFSILTPI